MELPKSSGIEEVTLTEVLGLDTWNQERTSEQLRNFIERKHAAVDGFEDLELL